MNHFFKHKRKVALFICILFVAAIAFSSAYIVKESNHDCIGHHCPICAHIQTAEKAIEQFGIALLFLWHSGFAFLICSIILLHFICNTVHPTPITQNVRMNN